VSTYTPIASVTLSSAQSSVTFSGIPQTYTDLVLVASAKGSVNDRSFLVRFNSDTGSNYSGTYVFGSGSSASSGRYTSESSIRLGAVISNTNFDTYVVSMNNYSNSTTFKSVLSRENVSTIGVVAMVGLWRNTSAITTLDFLLNEGTFASGTTFNLYGVANASITNVAKATGGDSVYTDGTYWYHIFRSSGTFTPTQALTADYLVVAGGGGAAATASYYVGGGGAGGLRCTVGATGGGGSLESAVSLTNGTAYTITVGAGGAGGNTTGAPSGISGSNSSISGTGLTTITSTGGGSSTGSVPNTGGSGGGGTINNNGAAGTANQGYAGGNGSGAGVAGAGGGGGGAGGAGTNGNGATNTGGNGGAGVTTAISGTSTSYAGGGGGTSNAAGGTATAGGGAGKTTGTANSGTANTGGGGGGTNNFNGGSGGSGIVIIRYAA
jgi:hypothetical protein